MCVTLFVAQNKMVWLWILVTLLVIVAGAVGLGIWYRSKYDKTHPSPGDMFTLTGPSGKTMKLKFQDASFMNWFKYPKSGALYVFGEGATCAAGKATAKGGSWKWNDALKRIQFTSLEQCAAEIMKETGFTRVPVTAEIRSGKDKTGKKHKLLVLYDIQGNLIAIGQRHK